MNEYEIEEPNISARKLTGFVLVFLVLASFAAWLYYEAKINRAESSVSLPVTLQIEKGSSIRQIASLMIEKKLIDSPRIFMVYVYLHNAQSKIQAGEYALDGNMPITQMVDVLSQGRVVSTARSFTIIEGSNNKQIANYLALKGLINDPKVFDQALSQGNFKFTFADLGKQFNYQGFLFPDTYTLSRDATVADLILKMLANFETKITPQMLADIRARHFNLGDVLILASIIEKEVGRNKDIITADDSKALQQERILVASVFYNRLKISMPLESDATVNYITGRASRSATIADTKIKSPYNTYQNQGLPPLPISNPGLDSIKAAIYPANSDYLYFLNAPDGTAYFAKTLAEHNANKAKYLK